MGLGNSSGGNTTFLTIINGKITKKVTENTPGAIARTNKRDAVVYELHYTSLSGKLKSIDTKEGEYGKQWIITIVDGIDNYQISIPYSGSYAYGILRRIPLIDLNTPITIKTGIYEEKAYLTIYQGEKVPYYFTKEEPNGLPDMEKIKVKGKDTWDDTKRLIWLENYVFENITPKLKELYDLTSDNTENTHSEPSHEESETWPPDNDSMPESTEDDGLPF